MGIIAYTLFHSHNHCVCCVFPFHVSLIIPHTWVYENWKRFSTLSSRIVSQNCWNFNIVDFASLLISKIKWSKWNQFFFLHKINGFSLITISNILYKLRVVLKVCLTFFSYLPQIDTFTRSLYVEVLKCWGIGVRGCSKCLLLSLIHSLIK